MKKEEAVVEEVALSEPAKDSTAQSDTPTSVLFNLHLYAHIKFIIYCSSESTTDLAKEVDGLTLASPVSIPEALEADTQVLKEAVPAAIAVAA